MGFTSLLTIALGLVFVVVGMVLGVLDHLTLGAMVGLILGIGTIAVGYIFKDED